MAGTATAGTSGTLVVLVAIVPECGSRPLAGSSFLFYLLCLRGLNFLQPTGVVGSHFDDAYISFFYFFLFLSFFPPEMSEVSANARKPHALPSEMVRACGDWRSPSPDEEGVRPITAGGSLDRSLGPTRPRLHRLVHRK